MPTALTDVLAGRAATAMFRWDGAPDANLADIVVAAGWQYLSLDTAAVRDRESFYAEVSGAWELPPWFGNNLDALYDVLSDVAAVPTVLCWDNWATVWDADPQLCASVLEVVADAAHESSSFAVVLHGPVRAPVSDCAALT